MKEIKIQTAVLRINQTLSLGGNLVQGCTVMVVRFVDQNGDHHLTDYRAVTPTHQEWVTWTKEPGKESDLYPWVQYA